MRYSFIRRQKKAYPISWLCQLLRVNRSGYYQYLKRNEQVKSDEEVKLETEARSIFSRSRQTYGSRRMADGLQKCGFDVKRYRAGSLMKRLGLAVKSKKRFKGNRSQGFRKSLSNNGKS